MAAVATGGPPGHASRVEEDAGEAVPLGEPVRDGGAGHSRTDDDDVASLGQGGGVDGSGRLVPEPPRLGRIGDRADDHDVGLPRFVPILDTIHLL